MTDEIPLPSYASSNDTDTLCKQMRQLVQLRWFAVLGQLLTIIVTRYGLGVDLPMQVMLSLLAGLVAFNALNELALRLNYRMRTAELFLGLLVDMAILTLQLYLSGGATNPFVFLYLLQVGLAAALLAPSYAWALLGVATVCFVWLAENAQPLELSQDYHLGIHSYYIKGILICLILNAALLVIFINRINRTHREHDARLAQFREREAEEDHILRMGLLASGAAHELGTPLSTIAVILGDWQRMPFLKSDPDLGEELTEMQIQIQRCKTIVSGILMSAGETRGESSGETTVCEFFDELITDWQSTRKVGEFSFQNLVGEDISIASDTVLKQTICNLLDNALEASPEWVSLEVLRQNDILVVRIVDQGPGFSSEILSRIGQPYQSTKGLSGSGLGLFFVFNVARILGGKVDVRNRQEGGAEINLCLPLETLRLKEA